MPRGVVLVKVSTNLTRHNAVGHPVVMHSMEIKVLNTFKKNKFEITWLGLAFLCVIISIVVSLAWPQGNWFCRSGAVMVLLSVIVEFHLGKLQQESNTSAIQIAGVVGVPYSGDLPLIKQYLAKTAHIFVIMGTLIWGYGDLIF